MLQQDTGVIILAAGSSTRLGQPKQKLFYKGKTLLQRAVDEAKSSVCKPVIVVLGSNAELIQRDIENEKVNIVTNLAWADGMGTGISLGIKKLIEINPQISNVIIMVSDQPFVNAELLDKMHYIKAENEKEIIACSYKNTLGVPVLFSKNFFKSLSDLKGQEGAKNILLQNKEVVFALDFPAGSVDIDTLEDYENLSKVPY